MSVCDLIFFVCFNELEIKRIRPDATFTFDYTWNRFSATITVPDRSPSTRWAFRLFRLTFSRSFRDFRIIPIHFYWTNWPLPYRCHLNDTHFAVFASRLASIRSVSGRSRVECGKEADARDILMILINWPMITGCLKLIYSSSIKTNVEMRFNRR